MMLSKEEIEEAKDFLWDIDDYFSDYSTDEKGNVIDEEMHKKAMKINNANYYIICLEHENKTLRKCLDNNTKDVNEHLYLENSSSEAEDE